MKYSLCVLFKHHIIHLLSKWELKIWKIHSIGSHLFGCKKRGKFLSLSEIFSSVLCLASQSCLTLCDPMDCGPPGSSDHGVLLARVLEWVAMPSSRGSSQPRYWTQVSCIAGGFFTISWYLYSMCLLTNDRAPGECFYQWRIWWFGLPRPSLVSARSWTTSQRHLCSQRMQHTESRPAWQKFLSWGASGSKSMARADVSGTEYETGLHFLHTWVFKILDSPCYDTQQQPLFNWGKWRRGCSGRKKPNCGMNVRIKRLSLRGLLPSPLYVFLYPIPTLLSLVPAHSFVLFWLHEPTSFLLFAVIQLDLYFLLLWYQPQHAV